MSIFAVNKLCRDLMHDRDFRAKMKSDPKSAMVGLNLTDGEREALLAGDVAALYQMGENSFLLGYLSRFEVCGLSLPIYNERIRAAKHT